jgi:hypothetical protein
VVVVAGSRFEPELFVVTDLHSRDVGGIPALLEQAVRETQSENVEHGRLAEEVIDAVHLALGHEARQKSIECFGTIQVGAERLFEREHNARGQFHLRQGLDDLFGNRGRQSEIDRRLSAAVAEDAGERIRIRRVGHAIGTRLDDGLDFGRIGASRSERRGHSLLPLGRGHGHRADPHKLEIEIGTL